MPGQSGNPAGRPKGKRDTINNLKVDLIARTGMLPIDFLTAVYRNQLFSDYETELLADGRTQVFRPAPGAKQLECSLTQRIAAATQAAPYIHRRQPVGLEVSDKNQRLITARQLAEMPLGQLEALLEVLDRLQVGVEFEGGGVVQPKLVGPVVEGPGRVV